MKRQILTALAVLATAGCADESSDPTAAELGRTLVPCALGKGVQLGVGEALTLRGEEASVLCVEAGGGGGEYTLVPFFATSNGFARIRVEAVGGNLQPVTGPPNPSLSPAGPQRDHELHMRLVERMRNGVSPLIRKASAPAARLSQTRASVAAEEAAADVPVEGGTISVNIPRFYLDPDQFPVCGEGYVTRQARVSAVTQRAILVNDPTNPAGGLTDAELRAFGEEFDRQIYPVDVQHFGTPTDLDQNGGRVIIVFTREVNALTPPASGGGYVGGFFFAGDLFPRVSTPSLGACPRSNVGEIFYLLAPDPTGAVNGNRFSRELVLRAGAGTIAHEFEHLINASRRIYVNNAETFEESWLDEGLAHIAEELNFYAASGLTPGQNLDLPKVTGTPRVLNALNAYALDNLVRYMTYLQAPDSNSVIGEDLLETRGGSWAFLRYSADRAGGGDQPFFFKLVNSRTSGLANMRQVINDSPVDWAQDWTLSVYTDDAVPGVDPRFIQPSWNFRSVMPRVAELFGEGNSFPLLVHPLASGGSQRYNIRGGGATYLRFGIGGSSRVGLRLTQGDSVPPASLRFSLVRTR